MNPVFGARRRAEEFHSMLEATPSSSGLPDARYDDLLGVVATLSHAPSPAARPAFVADLRSRLMLAAEGALAPAATTSLRIVPATRRSPRERRIAAAVGGFAIVSATASMAVAAQTALPGDTLYPLKRAIENAHAGVQSGADDKGTTMLGNASGRLEEVGELSRADDQDSTVIRETLQDFVDQASEASDLLLSDYASTGHAGSIEELRSFTAESIQALENLEGLIPGEVRSSLIEASMVVRQIDEQALSACPTCSDLPLTQIPAFAMRSVPIIRDLLGDGATASSKPVVKDKGKASPHAHQNDVAQPAQPTETGQVDPPVAPDPVLPTGTGNNQDGSATDGDDPLEDVTAPASSTDDPIGDLITGTGEVVEQALGTLTKP